MNVVSTPQSLCRCGVSRCDITPPVGIYHRMWGAASHDRSTGIHRPLTATALALTPCDGSNIGELVWVTLDHCLLWQEELQDLVQAVCAGTDLKPHDLIVTFSHTHGAGLLGRERISCAGGELIEGYLQEMGGRVAAMVRQARKSRKEATISYGVGRCAMAANRDFWDERTQQYVCGFNPDATCDDTVLVACVEDAEGKTVATVVNYACHPTTLAWQNTLISPDYVGAMRDVVEQATAAPCFFLQGASGDIGPKEGYVGDPAIADKNGRQLAYAALSVLQGLAPAGTEFVYQGPVISGATLGTWSHQAVSDVVRRRHMNWRRLDHTVELPYQPGLATAEQISIELRRWQEEEAEATARDDFERARDARAMQERQTRYLSRVRMLPQAECFPYPIRLLRLGDAVWIALEGELYNWLQRSLRGRSPNTTILVATLCGGSRCWYLPQASAYGKGLYQESASVLAAGCLETLEATLAQLLEHELQVTSSLQA